MVNWKKIFFFLFEMKPKMKKSTNQTKSFTAKKVGNKLTKRRKSDSKQNDFKDPKKENKEKKLTKSNLFWQEQTRKAREKREKKKLDELAFETVSGDFSVQKDEKFNEEIDKFNSSASDDCSESQGCHDNKNTAETIAGQEEQSSEDEESSGDEEDEFNEETKTLRKRVIDANRKGKKSGGFQSMGLSYPIFKAIQHKGYKIPTPIQRKAIPIILQSGDVVAMARTGSGKTAAFLIPLIERLKQHSAKVGMRALVLSPSRELAQQTLKFVCEFAKYTDLRACCLVGGDNLDDHFTQLASNPDIVIATPGRLMHLIIETRLEFKAVEYVVFDEADRLFELGFAEQLKEICLKLPLSRQTLLFSATLPKILVDFARAGLQNPTLIRLDVDTKISPDLQMHFFNAKHEEKHGALLYLLYHIIPQEQQTVIFTCTKHHVEFLQELLIRVGLSSTFIYGSLDQAARKINLAKFKYNKCKILVVTDVAARGIDIPLLDNVINYDFPSASKVFVHRVGRTARAGKSGNSYSLVTNDEIPYMMDLQLFTGRPFVFANQFNQKDLRPDYTREIIFGSLPLKDLTLEVESVSSLIKGDILLETLLDSAQKGYSMYIKSRPTASKPSYARAKEIKLQNIGIHPLFCIQYINLAEDVSKNELEQVSMISQIQNFRPSESIFELGKKGTKTAEAVLMQKRRKQLQKSIKYNLEQKDKIIKNEQMSQTRFLSEKVNQNVTENVDLEGFKEHLTNIKKGKTLS
jgi:ATP-dependent RNA helicase DDX54/DBP10